MEEELFFFSNYAQKQGKYQVYPSDEYLRILKAMNIERERELKT